MYQSLKFCGKAFWEVIINKFFSDVFIVCYYDFSFIFNKDDQDKKVESLMAPSKKQESLPLHQETKQETGSKEESFIKEAKDWKWWNM